MQNSIRISNSDEIKPNQFHSSNKAAQRKIMSGGKFNIGGKKNFCKINKSYLSITKGFLRVPLIVNLK